MQPERAAQVGSPQPTGIGTSRLPGPDDVSAVKRATTVSVGRRELASMLLRVGLWISVVTIPVLIVLGAPLAFVEYGWITIPIAALVAYELLITLHENLAELGLEKIASKFPSRIRNARK